MSSPHYDRGLALHRANRLAEALGAYDLALLAEPGHADALFNRGITLWALGRAEDALASTDAALGAEPKHFEASFNRAVMLSQRGRLEDALTACDRALSLKPDFAEGHSMRGGVLRELGRLDEALMSFDAALRLKPDNAAAHNNRGGLLQQMNRSDAALAAFDAALRCNPRHANAFYNRGLALETLGRMDEALKSFDGALASGLIHEELLVHRGDILWKLGRRDAAFRSFERAVATAPDGVAARLKICGALYLSGRMEDALAALDQVLALDPGNPDAVYNRANVLLDLKRYDEAVAGYEETLRRAPGHPHAFVGLVSAAQHLCDWDRLDALSGPLEEDVRAAKSVILPFVLTGFIDDPALQRLCAENYRRHLVPVMPAPLWDGKPYNHAKIRIAYLSADFQHHATTILMAELFERHDRDRFEIHALSFGEDDGTEWRTRLTKAFDHFHDARHLSDQDAAKLLRSLEIDIAVDLKGYTALARPEILSWRPAPVQVSYLGYPGTMGADFIDYIIGDPIVTPFAHKAFYAEKIVQLPGCYQVNDSTRRIAPATPGRAEAGLPENGFVFCSFNIQRKLSRPVFAVWMRLLAAVPGSVLWLLVNNAGARAKLRQEAAASGITAERIIFADRTGLEKHLARHRLADLFLDTLPYNSHTTASDALWAGLPLLTCMGKAFPARVAASLLEAVGLTELVTGSLGEYEAMALALARDPARLQAVREKLGANRLVQPLFDTERFRRNVEAAFTTMHAIAQSREAPRAFAI